MLHEQLAGPRLHASLAAHRSLLVLQHSCLVDAQYQPAPVDVSDRLHESEVCKAAQESYGGSTSR